jgi:hypothetical protein
VALSTATPLIEERPKKENHIRPEGNKYVLYSSDGQRRLAEHFSREAAEQHQQALDKILAGV